MVFKHPFTLLVTGPTGSGKTQFVTNLLLNADSMINKTIDRIIYCYGIYLKETFDLLKKHFSKIEFIEGIDDNIQFNPKVNNFIILDDLMNDGVKSDTVSNLLTRGSHHLNLSVILLTQNLFHKGKNSRSINLNCQYLAYFKNPRDLSQINHLARQMYPKKSGVLIEACKDATKKPYGYLLLDLKQDTDENCRLRTNIFPSDKQSFIYIPK